MDDDKRSGDEITRQLEKLRNRVAELEAELSDKGWSGCLISGNE